MKYGPAIALVLATLPLPVVVAQHGSAHGGSFGSRGFGGHAGFSAHPGMSAHPGFSARPGVSAAPRFSAPRSFAPASPIRYGSLGPPPAVHFSSPRLSTLGAPRGRNGFITSRPRYQPGFAGRDSAWNRNGNGHWDHDRGRGRDWDHDGDRDRFRGRAHSFQNWYLYSYPAFLGYSYPYDLGSGFYDYSNYDNSGYNQNDQSAGYNDQSSGYNDQVSGYQPEYEASGQTSIQDYGQPGAQPPPWPGPGASGAAPQIQPSDSGLHAAFEPPLEGPLTVVFKNGRAPQTMQDYMLTAKVLTDLDAHHYEQIPLDQIDITATANANRASGQDFQVPGASRD